MGVPKAEFEKIKLLNNEKDDKIRKIEKVAEE